MVGLPSTYHNTLSQHWQAIPKLLLIKKRPEKKDKMYFYSWNFDTGNSLCQQHTLDYKNLLHRQTTMFSPPTEIRCLDKNLDNSF